MKTSDRRFASILTKHFLDRAIFTETAGDLLHQRDQNQKRKLFRLSRNKWVTDKPGLEFEMAPLSKKRLGHLGSSASDDSSMTSDSLGRVPTPKRVFELKILCERNEQSPRVAIKKMNTNESVINSSSEELKLSLDKDDNNVINKTVGNSSCENACTNYNASETQRISSSGSLDVVQRDEANGAVHGRQLSDTSYAETRQGSTSVDTQDPDEEFYDQVFQNENDNETLPNNNHMSLNKENTESAEAARVRRSGVHERSSDRSLASRRPSGVPSVRRRLTSDDNAILNNIANKWLVNEVNANESSVV